MAEAGISKSDEDPWLTVQQVSKELGVHEATVRTWIATKRLAASRPGLRGRPAAAIRLVVRPLAGFLAAAGCGSRPLHSAHD
jgi:excisionase family DNA binding protein